MGCSSGIRGLYLIFCSAAIIELGYVPRITGEVGVIPTEVRLYAWFHLLEDAQRFPIEECRRPLAMVMDATVVPCQVASWFY